MPARKKKLCFVIMPFHREMREIRGKLLSVEFHRQVPIDQFIVDFYCHELMLVIEIDGITHDSESVHQQDLQRQKRIESFGVSFLRYYDRDVKENLQGVVNAIENWIRVHRRTSP